MREIKFRAMTLNGNWVEGLLSHTELKSVAGGDTGYFISNQSGMPFAYHVRPETICQFINLTDKNDIEWYVGDIGEFDNGDRFILRMEEWLEVFVEWIGEPECEDQARDLCRISSATRTGNIHDTK